ncbi:MAG: 4-hydroxybenzoate octaprenyltransferase [Alphaproteobacteria bacterium]
MPTHSTDPVNLQASDAPPGNWVDNYAPAFAQPYLRLMRADRPIGTWLLLWPCWWSLTLAWGKASARPDLSALWTLLLFGVGAMVMRGAGCVYNDIADRNFDAKVERTRTRPIPSGQVSVKGAIIFMVALCLVGLAVLLQFNAFAIVLGISSLLVVSFYPFMKRITYWPQSVLGLAFSWGALMGWAVVFGRLEAPAFLLYAAAVTWTIGYDTIYAHQDKDDDAILGLKSTALKFGERTKPWLVLFFGATLTFLVGAGWTAGAGWPFFAGLVLSAAHLSWQVITLDIDNGANCLKRFRANRDFGALVFIALLANMFF